MFKISFSPGNSKRLLPQGVTQSKACDENQQKRNRKNEKKNGENKGSLHTSFNAQAMSYQNHQFWRTAFKHGLKQQHIILEDGELVSAAISRKTSSRFN